MKGSYSYSINRLRIFFLLSVIIFNFFPKASNAQDTLHVNGSLLVPAGEVLEISPGTVVLFHGYYHIGVEGSLMVLGTEATPVVFTAADTTLLYDTHMGQGGWNGIRIYEVDGENVPGQVMISHAIFEFSKASKEDFENGGAISIYGERDVILQNSIFHHNFAYRRGGALYLEGNDGQVSHCTFFSNTAQNSESEIWPYGGGVAVMNSRAEISWSLFQGNRATGMGGGLNVESSHIWLHNNRFVGNDAPLGGGIGVVRTNSSNTFSNNLIVNNFAMFFGGAIAFVDAAVVVANSNILNNNAGYGGALYFNYVSSPKFYNSIIRGNRMYPDTLNQVWIFDAVSAPEFYNCNIEGGFEGFHGSGGDDFPGVYQDNIDADPLFADASGMDYSLLEGSPCIDAGYHLSADLGIFHVDLAGNERFSGMYVDIGAYEFQDPLEYFSLAIHTQGQGNTLPEAGEYIIQEGVEVEIQAMPHEGWRFDHWSLGDQVVYDQQITIEIVADVEITAVFQPETHVQDYFLKDLKVYPNPASGKLFLSFSQNQFSGEGTLIIRCSQGRIERIDQWLLEGKTPQKSIDVGDLTPGLFFVELITGDQRHVVKIIIK